MGHEFFGADHPPCNLWQNEQELEFITKKLNNLLRFNVWCDAVLARQGNYFVFKNTNTASLTALNRFLALLINF